MNDTEFRYCELRSEGRLLTGTAIRYGDTANIANVFQERIMAGAFGDLGSVDILLNVQHDRTRPLARTGAGLRLLDDARELNIVADIPATRDGDDVLTMVRGRILRGLSIEFKPVQQKFIDGVRVIDRAVLRGIAVVDSPAYKKSVVEARYQEFLKQQHTQQAIFYL